MDAKVIFKGLGLLVLSAAIFGLAACGNKTKKDPQKPVKPVKEEVVVPDFNGDSAYHFVAKQVSFGPRIPHTKSHAECAKWLVNKLSSYSAKVYEQDFVMKAYNDKNLRGKNIIGSFNPESNDRIILAAHWDSRPFADHDPDPTNFNTPIDGANDGASGVGVLIEVARILNENKIKKGVDIILFDLEDHGEPEGHESSRNDNWALGSQYWSANPHIPGYTANYGILLDMVGAKDATFYLEGTSMHFAPNLMQRFWNSAIAAGYGKYFIMQTSSPITDDHLYVNQIARIPMIDIVHQNPVTKGGFFPYWHTVNDNMENIDPTTLEAVGQAVLQYIYSN